jgi:hypothetical protein
MLLRRIHRNRQPNRQQKLQLNHQVQLLKFNFLNKNPQSGGAKPRRFLFWAKFDKIEKIRIEIEGSKKAIQKTAKILGLDLKKGITRTYWGLWKDFRKRKGIKEENIIFKK